MHMICMNPMPSSICALCVLQVLVFFGFPTAWLLSRLKKRLSFESVPSRVERSAEGVFVHEAGKVVPRQQQQLQKAIKDVARINNVVRINNARVHMKRDGGLVRRLTATRLAGGQLPTGLRAAPEGVGWC